MLVLFIWALIAVGFGAYASKIGRSGIGWFLICFITSPIVAGILLLVLPKPSAKTEESR